MGFCGAYVKNLGPPFHDTHSSNGQEKEMNKFRLNKINALAAIAVLALSGIVSAQMPGDGARSANASGRTDGQIESDVVQALDASEALKNDLITAATIQGAVTLSGTVASDSDRQLAEAVAKKVPGVTQVNNNLRVGDPSQDPNATPQADNAAAPMPDDQDNVQQQAPPRLENGQQQPQYGQQQPQYGQQQAPPPQYGNQQPEYGQAPP